MMKTHYLNLRDGPQKHFLAYSAAALLLMGSLPVSANQLPKADFTVDPTSGPAPLEVTLDASASSDPEGGIQHYEWSAADQTTAGLKASMTFENPGTHEIELVVIDEFGASDTAHQTVLISTNQRPKADFTVTPKSGPAPLEVTLDASASSDPDDDIESYEWSAAEQTTAGQKASMTFTEAGSHKITLVVTDGFGASDTVHQTVTVTKPAPQLEANFTVSPEKGTEPLTVTLDASTSTGKITDYEWSISDGKTKFGQNVTLTFQKAGSYTITLTVTTRDGDTATSKPKSIVVEQKPTEPAPENKPPLAEFEFSVTPEQGNGPFTVSLDGSHSSDQDGTIVNYEWHSEGQTTSGNPATLVFQEAGTYVVTLTVTDNDGATVEMTQDVEINGEPIPWLYNSTARLAPQVIAAGVTPSKVDLTDDNFDIVALVRPGASPIRTVSFQSTQGPLKMGMTPAGVLANGDELYKLTFIYPRGSLKGTFPTAWGSKPGQYNIVVTDESQKQSHTYPYLMIGNFPAIESAATKPATAISLYNSTARSEPQVIMAGYTPAILDIGDDQFDVIAIVRAGVLPIKHVALKQNSEGLFFNKMELVAADVGNGDKMYKFTYTYAPGSLGPFEGKEEINYKDLWGPEALQFSIEVVDEGGQSSHKFPDIEFGNYPELER
ncbi:MAG: hypothetical protein DRR08_11330 [Candidatus Parabeggiatoa sp. nov. 2]|nr:MAG: hypothetical protein DRR08_11330 [Gammaproteobacteria bacterium]